eukprot:314952_1
MNDIPEEIIEINLHGIMHLISMERQDDSKPNNIGLPVNTHPSTPQYRVHQPIVNTIMTIFIVKWNWKNLNHLFILITVLCGGPFYYYYLYQWPHKIYYKMSYA